MFMSDTLTLDAPRRTKEGFLAVRAKAARSGVYDYLGSEVDPTGTKFKALDTVKVYRPADEVFDKLSVGSFFAKPITDEHPQQPVTKDNWRSHARGAIMGAMKDGEYLAFDLALMDASAIDAVDSGKCELSGGYSCDVSIEDGTAPDGTAYQAIQSNIRGNHVAIVRKGRAGAECRIGDAAKCDALPTESLISLIHDSGDHIVKKILIDGLQVDLSDASAVEAAITKLQGQLVDATTARATAETQVATLTTQGATKDAEIVTLKQQVTDAKVTPAQMRDAAKAYSLVADQAKKLGITVTDAMDEGAIKKAAVLAKLGDVAKDWNDEQIAASFGTLTASMGDGSPDPLRTVISSGVVSYARDNASVRDLARQSQYN